MTRARRRGFVMLPTTVDFGYGADSCGATTDGGAFSPRIPGAAWRHLDSRAVSRIRCGLEPARGRTCPKSCSRPISSAISPARRARSAGAPSRRRCRRCSPTTRSCAVTCSTTRASCASTWRSGLPARTGYRCDRRATGVRLDHRRPVAVGGRRRFLAEPRGTPAAGLRRALRGAMTMVPCPASPLGRHVTAGPGSSRRRAYVACGGRLSREVKAADPAARLISVRRSVVRD